jgi:serine/threonine protein kinase
VPSTSRALVREAAAQRWQAVLDLFVRAGRGLAAAHAAGVVHRDFKPDNVLVGRDGRVKVLDFGLAQAQGGDGPAGAAAPEGAAAQDSLVGGLLGTPAYMAPEQHEGLACDARADQFSFCVALWEGLYGSRPFAGANQIEVADAIRAGAVQPVPRDSGVPRWLHRVLLRGLARDPAERFPSMQALLEELERDRGRLRRLWLVGGVAAMLGLWVQLALVERAEPRPEAAQAAAQALRGIERALLESSDDGAGQQCMCPGEDEPATPEKPVPADR